MKPFSLFLRADRPNYYVAFKNETTGRFLPAISTKKDNEKDALRQAWAWYREGIPSRGGQLDINTVSLRNTIKQSSVTMSDAEFIIQDLKQRGFVLSCVFAGASDAVSLSSYLDEFWDFEKSPYIREKLRADHSIHKNYVSQMRLITKRYWLPYFSSALLGDILPVDIERFVDYLSSIRYGDNCPLSNNRKNDIIKAGVVPLRWAFRKGKIKQDITQGLILFSNRNNERKILTPELAASIFNQSWSDERCRLANMTAMVTGLRAGELQGLLYEDLGKDCLFVRHSWNRIDKLKVTKTNTERVVLIAPCVLLSLKCIAELNPHGYNNKSYVFWSTNSAKKPMEQIRFVYSLREALQSAGISKINADEFSFHAWRHYFTTHMRNKLDDKLLQSQTGHKTIAMLERYSAHLLPGDSDKIREAQREVFSLLLPS